MTGATFISLALLIEALGKILWQEKTNPDQSKLLAVRRVPLLRRSLLRDLVRG